MGIFAINSNLTSINAQRNLFAASSDLSTRINRLSSGLRINKAADDAAGLTASEGMRAQIRGQKTSSDNISRAITLLQTADSGLEQIGNMYARLKELAIQSADGTLNNDNRTAVSAEATALVAEIGRISQATTFNGFTLIASASGQAFTFFIGDGTQIGTITNQRATITLQGITIQASGLASIGTNAVNVTVAYFGAQSAADLLVTAADQAVNAIAQNRTIIGAFQNRLERSQSNLLVAIENTSAAESVIRDADFATEGSALTRAQILVQAGSAMLAQANMLPQGALQFVQ